MLSVLDGIFVGLIAGIGYGLTSFIVRFVYEWNAVGREKKESKNL